MYNPENPYVFNENYYANITSVPYKDTSSYLAFRASSSICAILSILSIGLVVYLVIFRKFLR
jgi:hypothetical protein